jgi:hypothetical protein
MKVGGVGSGQYVEGQPTRIWGEMGMVGDVVKDSVFRQSTINSCLSVRAEIWSILVNLRIIRYWVGALVDRWH